MKTKVWYKTTISTEDQNINIKPTDNFDSITIDATEVDGKQAYKIFLTKDEMEVFIEKMREMMNYLTRE